jgi:hypothetical protein
MYRVIVASGLSLTAGAVVAAVISCSGNDGMPSEGPVSPLPDVDTAVDALPETGSDIGVHVDTSAAGDTTAEASIDAADAEDARDVSDASDALDAGDVDDGDTFPREGPPP